MEVCLVIQNINFLSTRANIGAGEAIYHDTNQHKRAESINLVAQIRPLLLAVVCGVTFSGKEGGRSGGVFFGAATKMKPHTPA